MSKENVFNSARIFIKKLLSGEVDTIIKKIWYVFLLVVGSVYVWKSRYDIYSLSAINASHVISIIWLIVIITPVFSEVELFGFKFKKEVEKIEEQVKEIKASIITMQMQSTTHLYNYFPTSLPNVERENLESQIESKYPKNDMTDVFQADDDTVFLFTVRWKFEQLLNKIAFNIDIIDKRNVERAYVNSPTLLRNLFQQELIDRNIYNALREIFSTCNKAVHGHDVSAKEVDFVKKTAPNCLTVLMNIGDSFNL